MAEVIRLIGGNICRTNEVFVRTVLGRLMAMGEFMIICNSLEISDGENKTKADDCME